MRASFSMNDVSVRFQRLLRFFLVLKPRCWIGKAVKDPCAPRRPCVQLHASALYTRSAAGACLHPINTMFCTCSIHN